MGRIIYVKGPIQCAALDHRATKLNQRISFSSFTNFRLILWSLFFREKTICNIQHHLDSVSLHTLV